MLKTAINKKQDMGIELIRVIAMFLVALLHIMG